MAGPTAKLNVGLRGLTERTPEDGDRQQPLRSRHSSRDRSDTADVGHSQRLLGHKNREMTEHYVRKRVGQRVRPLR